MSYLIEPAAGRVTSRKLVLACLLGAAAMVPMLPGGLRPLDLRTQVVLAALSVMLFSFAALELITALPDAARGVARWRIGPWYLLWSFFAFGLASITWLGQQSGSATQIALPSVVRALTLFAFSVVVWTAGYVAGPPGFVRAYANRGLSFLLRGTGPALRPSAATPWVLYGIGSAARLCTLALTGGYGYLADAPTLLSSPASYGQLLHILSFLAVFAIATAAYRVFSNTGGGLITLLVLVGIEATVGALSGGKESFVVSILAVLVPYGAVRGRLSVRVLLIGGLLFLWVIVPFNTAYREAVRGQHRTLSPSEAISAAPEIASDVVRSGSPAARLVDSATTMLYRVREIDNMAIIMQRTPVAIPYRSPLEFAPAPLIGLVPRAVWPDKPVLANGYRFSKDYYGSTTYTSTAITTVGDLYRHGGWPVTVVGMLLLGAGCRMFDMLFRPETDVRAVCFLLVFLPIVVKAEVDVVAMIASVPAAVLTAVLGAHLMCRVRPSEGERCA